MLKVVSANHQLHLQENDRNKARILELEEKLLNSESVQAQQATQLKKQGDIIKVLQVRQEAFNSALKNCNTKLGEQEQAIT